MSPSFLPPSLPLLSAPSAVQAQHRDKERQGGGLHILEGEENAEKESLWLGLGLSGSRGSETDRNKWKE